MTGPNSDDQFADPATKAAVRAAYRGVDEAGAKRAHAALRAGESVDDPAVARLVVALADETRRVLGGRAMRAMWAFFGLWALFAVWFFVLGDIRAGVFFTVLTGGMGWVLAPRPRRLRSAERAGELNRALAELAEAPPDAPLSVEERRRSGWVKLLATQTVIGTAVFWLLDGDDLSLPVITACAVGFAVVCTAFSEYSRRRVVAGRRGR